MFRDRTNLYLSYRRTFPRNLRYSRSTAVKNEQSYDLENGNVDFEMETFVNGEDAHTGLLPPLYVEIAREIDTHLSHVKSKSVQLAKLYKNNSLPGFEDRTNDEKLIEDLSFQVIKLFQNCYGIMKRLAQIFEDQRVDGERLNKSELIILDNLQKHYAQRVQTESNKFRALQNNYLKFLNKDDSKPINFANQHSHAIMLEEDDEERLNQHDIELYSRKTLQKHQHASTNQQYLQVRDEEITKLARSVLEVSTIFREMQSLIIDQGTIVDRIDYNLENTHIELKETNKELDKATHYQKRTQKCKIVLLLSLCVITLFFIVMLKPHNGTKVIKHQYDPANQAIEGNVDPPLYNRDSSFDMKADSMYIHL